MGGYFLGWYMLGFWYFHGVLGFSLDCAGVFPDWLVKERIQKCASRGAPCFIWFLYRRAFRVSIFAGGL